MALTVYDDHTWSTFVAAPVNVTPDTRRIIEAIMPYFPKRCRCITGFQNEETQYWKVSYHWDLVVTLIDKALAVLEREPVNPPARGFAGSLAAQGIAINLPSAPSPFVGQLKVLKQQLLMYPPTPQHGYLDSRFEGTPRDTSSHAQTLRRWEVLKVVKGEFALIIRGANLKTLAPPAARWDLAVAAVRRPGTSKHGEGWALDIEGAGENRQIKDISRALGATLTYDEGSHVHVEFAHGVQVPP